MEVFVQQSAQIQVKVWEGMWLQLYCLLAGTFFWLFQEFIVFDPYTKAFSS